LIILGSVAAGLLTSKFIFIVLTLGSGSLLAMSLIASRRPLIQALQNFEKCQVEVRIWGAPYPPIPFGALVLTSVNALGAGIHIFFSIDGDASMHLKVAQPGDSTIAPNTVVISTAR
jgi:hypothetical protein